MCVETLRTGLVFPRWSIWGVTCLGLVEKLTFSCLCPWKHHKCVLKPSEQGLFFWDNQFERSHAKVYSKNEHFPIYFLRNTTNVCLNPHNSAHFSQMIDLRGHMSYVYSKNEHFPIYLLKNPINVCWNPHNRAHFSETIDLRHHMPRFTQKMNVFLCISWQKCHSWPLDVTNNVKLPFLTTTYQ